MPETPEKTIPSDLNIIWTSLKVSIIGTILFSIMMTFVHSIIEPICSEIPAGSPLITTANSIMTMTTLTPLNIEFTFLGLLVIGILFYKNMKFEMQMREAREKEMKHET